MKFVVTEVIYGDCLTQDLSAFEQLKELVEVWEDECGTRFEIKEEDFNPFYTGAFQNIKNSLEKEVVDLIEKVKEELSKTSSGYIFIELWK